MAPLGTSTHVYTRTHSANFTADNLRTIFVRIIRQGGLSPTKLIDDWETVGRALVNWLESGHLRRVTIEFFKPGSTFVQKRWDFDVTYTGSGVPDDMWADFDHLTRTMQKAGAPSADCTYRVLLSAPNGAKMPGMEDTHYLNTGSLRNQASGTAIATHDISASMGYWR